MKKIIVFLMLLMISPTVLFAKTVISGLAWETSPASVKPSTSTVYSEITELPVKGLSFDRLRAVVSLNNSADKKEMGIVLRYSLRIQLKNEETGEIFWEVPYHADTLRIPVVKAGITKDAKINSLNLKFKEQLKRLQNTGYVPVAIKLEIMLAPRKGVSEDGRIEESILPIMYENAPAKEPIINKLPIKRNKTQQEKK